MSGEIKQKKRRLVKDRLVDWYDGNTMGYDIYRREHQYLALYDNLQLLVLDSAPGICSNVVARFPVDGEVVQLMMDDKPKWLQLISGGGGNVWDGKYEFMHTWRQSYGLDFICSVLKPHFSPAFHDLVEATNAASSDVMFGGGGGERRLKVQHQTAGQDTVYPAEVVLVARQELHNDGSWLLATEEIKAAEADSATVVKESGEPVVWLTLLGERGKNPLLVSGESKQQKSVDLSRYGKGMALSEDEMEDLTTDRFLVQSTNRKPVCREISIVLSVNHIWCLGY